MREAVGNCSIVAEALLSFSGRTVHPLAERVFNVVGSNRAHLETNQVPIIFPLTRFLGFIR